MLPWQTAMTRTVILKPKKCVWLSLLLVFTLAAGGCLKATRPNLPRIFPPPEAQRQTGKNPVIVIPGILGSRLINRKTREQVWPGIFLAQGDTLALPISSPRLAENTDDLAATEIIETARLARLIPEISVYDSLLLALERYGGYRRGSFDAPEADGDRDTFYVFAYDWRRDNVESARLLAQKIARLKQQLHRPDLRFDLIAHSMGGLVARYYAMYGDRDLTTAATPQPDWSGARHLRRMILLGTPNAGSMDALRTLLLGYSLTEAHRPRVTLLNLLGREVTFTAPAVYQLLPHDGYARFLDAALSPIKLDIYDIATWRRWGWSVVFEEAFREREQRALLKQQGDSSSATAEGERLAAERERFLSAALARAAAFHRALDVASTPPESLRLYLFGGDCEPTLDAAMIATIKGQTLTLFRSGQAPGGREARRRAFQAMFSPGDGRVTRRSLFGLKMDPEANDSMTRAMKQHPFYATFSCELHGDLPLNLTLQDNLLTVLLGNSY